MVVVVGLGNPGKQYDLTRHNAGFLALDFLKNAFGFDAFQEDKKYHAEIAFGKVGKSKVILVKPNTFMNESGKSVRLILDFYKLTPASLVVIHDEVDLPSGVLRTTPSSRSAGHNGIQNIIDSLGTQDFFRIRLGIGRPVPVEGSCITIHDYVLQKFSSEEMKKLESLFPEMKEILESRIK